MSAMNVLTVIAVEFLTPAIFELTIERGPYRFCAGACAVLFDADGHSRPYSIASGTQEPCLRFLIRRIPQGHVSNWLAGRSPGDAVTVSPPFGDFRPAPHQAPCLFVATGVGIAPFLSTLRSPPPPTAPVRCLYGVRHHADAADLPLLRRHSELHLAVSREPARQGSVAGRVTSLLATTPLTHGLRFYLCGYETMIEEAIALLTQRGVPTDHIATEAFFPAPPRASR